MQNFSQKPATYTQPLLFNGYTNWGINNDENVGKDNLPANTSYLLYPDEWSTISKVVDWESATNYANQQIKPDQENIAEPVIVTI